MNVKVTTKITDNRIPMIVGAFPGLMEQVVEKTAFDIEATAKELAPVDTGYLAGTIWTDNQGLRAEVQTVAEYAAYVEYGTYKMAAQPYMRRAADMHEPKFTQAIDAAVKSLMG
jgi:HK97 gp10 family phage protein